MLTSERTSFYRRHYESIELRAIINRKSDNIAKQVGIDGSTIPETQKHRWKTVKKSNRSP